MAKKPVTSSEFKYVVYNMGRWTLLKELREKAIQLMEALEKAHLNSIVYGSIARGDVTAKSDVDVFIPCETSSFIVENSLERSGININKCFIVQATPAYAMKAFIEIDERTSVSFPLMKMRNVEREFYRFGGQASLKDLIDGKRVCGVDKRLMLIEPTDDGHRESTIIGREEHVAKFLGINVKTVLDRVHALLRRDKVGRTGVFIKKELVEGETFELALEKLVAQNPAVRRRLKTNQ